MMTRHNLPARPYQRLIGRETELAEIKSRLAARSRDWIIAIEGIGGLGKTALALEAAWRCVERAPHQPPNERFSAVIWTTARCETAGADAIMPDAARRTGLDDMFQAMAQVLDLPHLPRLATAKRCKEAYRIIGELGRVLLILDNLEDIDDPEIPIFLRDLPKGSKTIATLRFHEDMPDPITLPRLDLEATSALVQLELEARQVKVSPEVQTKLARASRGLPAVVRWAVGQAAEKEEGIVGALRQLDEDPPEVVRNFLQGILGRLQRKLPDAYFALLACSFFDLPAGVEPKALPLVLDLSPEQCAHVMQRLVSLNLVDRGPGGRYTLLPLANSILAAERDRHPDWERAARGRWIAVYEELAYHADDPAVHARLQAERPNLLRALAWLRERVERGRGRGAALHLATLFPLLQRFLFDQGCWDELLLAANALLAYLESTSERNAGSSEILVAVLQSSLDIYSRRAEFADGERLLKRVGLLFPTPRPELLQAEMLLAEARLKFNDGTMMVTEKLRATSHGLSLEEARRAQARLVAEAIDHVTRALPIYRAYRKTDKVIQALTTLGNCLRAAGRFQDAETYYLQALHELDRELERERFKVDQRAAVLRANLALVKGRQGNYLDACKDLRDIVGQLVEPTDRIEAYAALALYEYLRGNAREAQPWRTRADTLKDALGQGEISLCREDEQWQQREVLGREVWRERLSGN